MTQSIGNTLFRSKGIAVDVLRLDLIHPEVSGNKWFKLKYWLEAAVANHKNEMVSFGGAYSNHLVAMAFLCAANGLRSTGIIRGDEPTPGNASLQDMKRYGMDLIFVSREVYRDKHAWIENYLLSHPDACYVPEGGSGDRGIRGAEDILQLASHNYTHIVSAIGTGTTFTGLINGSLPEQQVMGVYCLRMPEEENTVRHYVQQYAKRSNYAFIPGYHFGGFGKKTDELIRFMNALYHDEKIPTDFVYTGKLFFAVYDLAARDYFAPGSKVLVIHSGGLQGNRSLPAGVLDF